MTVSVPVTTITPAGVTVPTYASVFAALQSAAQQIFGANINLSSDTQDGQLIGVYAQAISDLNNAVAAGYNAFSPGTAQGAGLSSNVKINGLTRMPATNSTVPVLIVGANGAIITNGIISDGTNQWALPPIVTIPPGLSITVTATAIASGAVAAAIGTLTTIVNPQNGWYSVSNTSAAAPGQLVEQDGPLRARQALSTSNPAQTLLSGIKGAVAAVNGVLQSTVYENDTNTTNANGIPSKNIAPVVLGGSLANIAAAIATRKTLGTPTYGSTAVTYTDPNGNTQTINISVATQVQIGVALTLKNLGAYTTVIGTEVQAAVSAFINTYGIAATVGFLAVAGAAALPGLPDGLTFRVEAITIGVLGGSLTAADYVTAWNAVPVCAPSNVALTVI